MSQDVIISFTTPLGNAWQRMRFFLLHPFNAGLWFAVGFSAFLAGLGNSGGGINGIINIQDRLWKRDQDWQTQQHLTELTDNLVGNAGLILLIGFLILAGLIVWILFLWMSSRGHYGLLHRASAAHAAVHRLGCWSALVCHPALLGPGIPGPVRAGVPAPRPPSGRSRPQVSLW